MERQSQYFSGLSFVARERYKQKVFNAGLSTDPYCIERWHEQLESSPDVNWSDMLTYMTETPSDNTREAVKVSCAIITNNKHNHNKTGVERNARWRLFYESWMGPSVETPLISNHEGGAFIAMGKVCVCQFNFVLSVYSVS